jgi:hypothetical protein
MAQTNSPQAPDLEIPVEVPQKPQWECQIKTEPKDAKGFTVGEVFEVSCAGESLELEEPFKIINPESLQYSVVYLKTLNKTQNELTFLATSYASKTIQHPFLHISDAKGGGFISQKIEIRSQSVIDPQNPPQNIFGPIQPMTLNWPFWIFFAGILVGAVLIGWGAIFFRRYFQRKNLEKNIRKFQSPMGSYHQFSKDLRLLKRGVVFSDNSDWSESQTQSYLAKLDEIYRMFILREYTVPALNWSTAQIAKHVYKKNKVGYKHFESAFLKAFKELERAQSHVNELKPRDCEQLTNYCWAAVDSMWKYKNAGGR